MRNDKDAVHALKTTRNSFIHKQIWYGNYTSKGSPKYKVTAMSPLVPFSLQYTLYLKLNEIYQKKIPNKAITTDIVNGRDSTPC